MIHNSNFNSNNKQCYIESFKIVKSSKFDSGSSKDDNPELYPDCKL